MRAYQNVDGGFTFGVHEYDIAKTTAIKAGQVVKLAEGLVVAATAAETGAILGVAKENHSGAEDAINPRSNGAKILVYDDPGMIMRCKAPVMAATSGSATTFVSTDLATLADDDLNGGYIVLVEKSASSTNTDELGSVRRITGLYGDEQDAHDRERRHHLRGRQIHDLPAADVRKGQLRRGYSGAGADGDGGAAGEGRADRPRARRDRTRGEEPRTEIRGKQNGSGMEN